MVWFLSKQNYVAVGARRQLSTSNCTKSKRGYYLIFTVKWLQAGLLLGRSRVFSCGRQAVTDGGGTLCSH